MTTSSSILEVIQHYQRSIERCQEDETRLLHCINKLYKLPIKVEHLQETGIGKTVNSLRKFNGEIGVAAKALVTKWKAMVAAEEEPMEANCQSNEDDKNHVNDRDSAGSSEDDQDIIDHNRNTEALKARQPITEHRQTSKEREKRDKQKHQHKEQKASETVDKHRSNSHHQQTAKHSSSSSNSAEKHHKSREREEKHEKERNKLSDRHKEKERSQSKQHKDNNIHKDIIAAACSNASVKEDSANHQGNASKDRVESKDRKNKDKDSRSGKSTSTKDKHHHDKERSKHDKASDKEKTSTKDKEQRDKHKSSSSKEAKHISSSSSSKLKTSADGAVNNKRRHSDSENDVDDVTPPAPETKVAKFDAKIVNAHNKKEVSKNEPIAGDDDDGIDSSMGANFADVLGMLNAPVKKVKKSQNTLKSPNAASGSGNASTSKHNQSVNTKEIPSKSGSSSKLNGLKSNTKTTSIGYSSPDVKPDLLSSSAKLEPLDPSIALELPTISTNYKPLPLNQTVMDCVFNTSNSAQSRAPVRTLSDAEALTHGISSKTMRTKIYSGVRTGQILQVPSLFDLCTRVLQKNIDALEYTGGVPFEVLRAVLERATPQQLLMFEEYNPYVMEDSDELWRLHCQRNYRTQKRQEMESWREMYLRCQEDQDRKLSTLAESIKQTQIKTTAPIRKTQLAFVDSMVKPPRNVQRKQEQYGTKSKLIATPAARVAALSSVTPNAAKLGDTRLRVAATVRDPAQVSGGLRQVKKAPLMAKTLQLMRGRHKR